MTRGLYINRERMSTSMKREHIAVMEREHIAVNVMEDDWPNNLIKAIGIAFEDPLDHLHDIGTLEVAMIMSSMNAREKAVIRDRFFNHKTQEEVANDFGVTRERIRQIEAKALRKLRYSASDGAGYIIRYGVKAYIDRRVDEKLAAILGEEKNKLHQEYIEKVVELATEERKEKASANDIVMAMTIEELNLGVRAYNCLKRSTCYTVKDIVTRFRTYEDAYKIRNLGRKSMDEVTYKLKTLGIEWPVRDEIEG